MEPIQDFAGLICRLRSLKERKRVIPLYVRDTDKTFEVTKLAFDEGIFINPVIPPACAPQDTLVRVALMATHTKEQVEIGRAHV